RRDLTSRGEKQDKRLVELEKRVEELSKILAEVRKQADPKGDFLDTLNRKIDGRTTQLAKWFDEYHPRKDIGSHHRDAIERIR
ncbi:MAG TPA: hypothetical protein VLM89_15080, partial [Phycisphaerae bacterium]|nr:hypothetical protein [Phycisphaerae bacterium]